MLERFELSDLNAIGHRVAHGGGKFAVPVIIEDATIAEIEALTPLAPLHNPADLQPVRPLAPSRSRQWCGITRIASQIASLS